MLSNLNRPLCVDLDGTLIKSDLFAESFTAYVAKKPFRIVKVLFWLLKGRAYTKKKLADKISIDVTKLTFIEDVVTFVRSEFERGRKTYLVTASDQTFATSVSNHLNIFSGTLASDGKLNLRSLNKAKTLEEKFGKNSFDYIGNSAVDIPVWKSAGRAFVVNVEDRFFKKIEKIIPIEKKFSYKGFKLKDLLKLIRVHQWIKNLLVFVPLLMAHKSILFSPESWYQGLIAFLSLSFVASSVYILNDLADINSDRSHPTKRLRPLAASTIPLYIAFILLPIFLSVGFTTAYLLGLKFILALSIYYLLTTLYTTVFKKRMLIDALVLAALYTIRIIAGGIATSTMVSDWLLTFSMFIFLSIAFAKRFIELKGMIERGINTVPGRGYQSQDILPVATIGICSGVISILVLMLYVTSKEVTVLYSKPQVLLIICPALLYWISRLWLLAYRGEVNEDPTIFAMKDWVSYIVAGIVALILFLAT